MKSPATNSCPPWGAACSSAGLRPAARAPHPGEAAAWSFLGAEIVACAFATGEIRIYLCRGKAGPNIGKPPLDNIFSIFEIGPDFRLGPALI